MIKVSRLADYAVVILVVLAESSDELMSASGVAERAGLPEPTVAKVLKLLGKVDIVSSIRGANGGYALHKKVDDISISDVVKAVDGPIVLTACVEGSHETCDYECSCPVKGRWNPVNAVLQDALADVTLADMTS